jgi:prepilin-type N-terminal cleavage/methylation domain-containing protein
VDKTEIIDNPPVARFTPQKNGKIVMKTKTSRKAGFTLVEIMIVVAIIGLLAAIAIPNFVRSRSTAQMTTCINNLRQIDGAKQEWALEKGQLATAAPADTDIGPYLGRSGSVSNIVCPIATTKTFAGSYTINLVNVAPVCAVNGTGQVDANYKHVLPN